jgi:hypothetical protein
VGPATQRVNDIGRSIGGPGRARFFAKHRSATSHLSIAQGTDGVIEFELELAWVLGGMQPRVLLRTAIDGRRAFDGVAPLLNGGSRTMVAPSGWAYRTSRDERLSKPLARADRVLRRSGFHAGVVCRAADLLARTLILGTSISRGQFSRLVATRHALVVGQWKQSNLDRDRRLHSPVPDESVGAFRFPRKAPTLEQEGRDPLANTAFADEAGSDEGPSRTALRLFTPLTAEEADAATRGLGFPDGVFYFDDIPEPDEAEEDAVWVSIDVDEARVAGYEVDRPPELGYREWAIPGTVAARFTVRMADLGRRR